jgi:hypothetical protein
MCQANQPSEDSRVQLLGAESGRLGRNAKICRESSAGEISQDEQTKAPAVICRRDGFGLIAKLLCMCV